MTYPLRCSSNQIIFFIELSNETHSINPCTSSNKDFYVIQWDNHEVIGATMLTSIARSSWRIKGCCSALSPLLHVTKLKSIMDVMRLSVGGTIPLSPRYSDLNSTQVVPVLDMLFQLDKLGIQLRNRYNQLSSLILYLI